MEENPERPSRVGSAFCLVMSAVAGGVGALFGTAQSPHDWIREDFLAASIAAGPVIGVAVAIGALHLRPRTREWGRVDGTTALSLVSMGLAFVLAMAVAWGVTEWPTLRLAQWP